MSFVTRPWSTCTSRPLSKGLAPAARAALRSTIALRVPDVAEAKAKLEAAGVQVNEMWDSGVCHGAGFSDPDGNRILLHRRYAPYADGTTP